MSSTGLIPCLEDIVSAYNEGRNVLQKVKNRRARKQLPVPDTDRLEACLDDSPLAIQVSRDRIIRDVGPTHDLGRLALDKCDHESIQALREIRLELRAVVFDHLVEALQTDDICDFDNVAKIAEDRRDTTLVVLHGLRRRLLGHIQSDLQLPVHGSSENVNCTASSGRSPVVAPTSRPIQPDLTNTNGAKLFFSAQKAHCPEVALSTQRGLSSPGAASTLDPATHPARGSSYNGPVSAPLPNEPPPFLRNATLPFSSRSNDEAPNSTRDRPSTAYEWETSALSGQQTRSDIRSTGSPMLSPPDAMSVSSAGTCQRPSSHRSQKSRDDDADYSPSYFPTYTLPWKKRGRARTTPKDRTVSEPYSSSSLSDTPLRRVETTSTASDVDRIPGLDVAITGKKSRFGSINLVGYGDGIPGWNAVRDVRDLAIASRPREQSSQSSQGRPVPRLPVPSEGNDYLGFCKGAWRLQNGSAAAFKERLEFNSGWSSSKVPYLACTSSKCAFACRLPKDKLDDVWRSNKGVAFRWHFLGKSHARQTRVENEQYAYLCIFCVLTHQDVSVYFGTETLMQHLSEHRTDTFTPEVLNRARCINDCIAKDDEDFDVNLYPPDFAHMSGRKSSRTWSQDVLGVSAANLT